MTIDMAWESLSLDEQLRIIGWIASEFMYSHTRNCTACALNNVCGAIQHIDDLLEVLTETMHDT